MTFGMRVKKTSQVFSSQILRIPSFPSSYSLWVSWLLLSHVWLSQHTTLLSEQDTQFLQPAAVKVVKDWKEKLLQMIKFFTESDTPFDNQLSCVLNNQSVSQNIIFLLKLKLLMLLISFLRLYKKQIFRIKRKLRKISQIQQVLNKIHKNSSLQIYSPLFWMEKRMMTKINRQKTLKNWIYSSPEMKKIWKIWPNQNGKNIWKLVLKRVPIWKETESWLKLLSKKIKNLRTQVYRIRWHN